MLLALAETWSDVWGTRLAR